MNSQEPLPFISQELPEATFWHSANLFDLLFKRMPMGVAILDPEFHIQRYNPTWGDFAARYAPPSGAPLTPGVGYFEHLPGTEAVVLPLFARALAGETVQQNGVRLEADGITTYWDIVLAPLTQDGETMGILNVAVDVTEQVQLRQNLEGRVEKRTRELQVLLEVTASANSSLNLNETLTNTLDVMVAQVGVARAGVLLVQAESGALAPYALRPEQEVAPDDLAKMLSTCQVIFASGENLYVAPDAAQGLREPGALLLLQTRGHKLGVLVIIGSAGSEFSSNQLALFQSIADQLSVAIENARLFEETEQAAIAAERNRLARDLHDAVTQTLFSASMIAGVLPQIWERNPDEGRRRLQELHQLTRGALSEMRTLLVELRPAALADTDLGDLIGHQVNAFIARARLEVTYTRDCAHNPPVEIKETFYRIAQEAFNNIAKYAEAQRVQVGLDCQPERVELLIEDDGVGFDQRLPNQEGLGLSIMRERAQNIGATLDVQSQIQRGTRLRLLWQALQRENQDDR